MRILLDLSGARRAGDERTFNEIAEGYGISFDDAVPNETGTKIILLGCPDVSRGQVPFFFHLVRDEGGAVPGTFDMGYVDERPTVNNADPVELI